MPATTPEMNQFACHYMDYLVERRLDDVLANSIDDESTQYSGIHSGLGPPDWSLQQAIDHLKTVPVSEFYDYNPVGWYEGDIAWFLLFPKSIQPDKVVFELRATLIARRINSEWKTVHWHVSESVDRAAAFGCD